MTHFSTMFNVYTLAQFSRAFYFPYTSANQKGLHGLVNILYTASFVAGAAHPKNHTNRQCLLVFTYILPPIFQSSPGHPHLGHPSQRGGALGIGQGTPWSSSGAEAGTSTGTWQTGGHPAWCSGPLGRQPKWWRIRWCSGSIS